MAAKGHRVVITDEPTRISSPTSDQFPGQAVTVLNPAGSGVTIDLGDVDVASGSGFELPPGSEKPMTIDPREAVFGVCPAGQQVIVQVFELGV